MILQILLSAVLLCLLLYAVKLTRRGNWLGILLIPISLAANFFVLFPDKSNLVANWLGVGRGADLLIYLCFLSGILLIVLIHLRFREQSIAITELARAIAISNLQKDANQSKS